MKWILPILIGILLVNIFIMILKFQGKIEIHNNSNNNENITEEEVVDPYAFHNESSMTIETVYDLILGKREELLKFFDNTKFYLLKDLDENSTEEDQEKYIVIDNEFISGFQKYITDNLYKQITKEVVLIKTIDNLSYYKVLKEGFEKLLSESSVATVETNSQEIYPILARDDMIYGLIKIKNCEDNANTCSRDDEYRITLVKENDNWIIDDIGTSN